MRSMIEHLLEEQHLKRISLGSKTLSIVDNHQYALLVWAEAFLKNHEPLTLVSIDYHPDTNPPFWLQAYQKAMAIDPTREDELVRIFIDRIMEEIRFDEIDSLGEKMALMRNDEHINTAMFLGYLKDYHMINCMEKHCYETGTHYLVPKAYFGSLKNEAFLAADFSAEKFLKNLKGPLILDVDLDYFMRMSDFLPNSSQMSDFISLCHRADLITSARSVTYFEHLRREPFSIEVCEKAFIELLRKILVEGLC